ncbi:MAG: hypothetical protein DLM57_19090 [Pseudonocardiales bacterium]|nr:MAG: hypothetical protein DLM57_19090 [Pseudonocardiales bacterium]
MVSAVLVSACLCATGSNYRRHRSAPTVLILDNATATRMTVIFNAAHRAKSEFVCSAGGIGRLDTVNFVHRHGPKQPVAVTPGCRPV